jgi:hypothetical protein
MRRMSALESIDVSSTGEVDRRYTYAFAQPVVHDFGEYFIGFREVTSFLRATDAPAPLWHTVFA